MAIKAIPYLAFYVFAVVCGFAIGFMFGCRARKEDLKSTAAEHSESLQKTYGNGIRVGEQMMLDMLVHDGTISEEQAKEIAVRRAIR